MSTEPNEEESPESYRVNVPATDAPDLAEGPETGYALVKYTKDGEAYCLDLQSLRLPAEQPEDTEAPESDADLPLEDLARKMGKEEGINTDS